MDLEELRSKFEDKTVGGIKYNILAYHPGQSYPVVMEVNVGGEWKPYTAKDNGEVFSGHNHPCSLIPKKLSIDHSALPEDVLCLVWDRPNRKFKRYSNGNGKFFDDGRDSYTSNGNYIGWDNVKILDNKWRVWFGGERTLPNNVKVKVRFRDGRCGEALAQYLCWGWNNILNADNKLVAYKVLDEDTEI